MPILPGILIALATYGAGLFATTLQYKAEDKARQEELDFRPERAVPYSEVQKVFDNRCVLCHSCNNAPCQLNLTSFEGFIRGATKQMVYQPERLASVPTTRLGIDAKTTDGWRSKGFFAIHEGSASENPLLRIIDHKLEQKYLRPDQPKDPIPTLNSFVCAQKHEMTFFLKDRPQAGMPYNLPAISRDEYWVLHDWTVLAHEGQMAKPPVSEGRTDLDLDERKNLVAFESFLNGEGLRERLVARYIFEHLFMAHVHLSEKTDKFFRLVRSRTACDKGIDEIATRRPSDDPGGGIHYCLKPLGQTIVEKTHLPYLIDDKKIKWLRNNFLGFPWQVKSFPSYNLEEAANPFKTFREIPTVARYRFLLEDAQYHVATFIKGPVCNGTGAVSSIDEHFFVFFMKPESDLLVRSPQFEKSSERLLSMPAEKGSDGTVTDIVRYMKVFPPLRNQYRFERRKFLKELYPQGLSLAQLWDGDGQNPNAALTVLRHDSNAYVLKGTRGQPARSAFVLDYALFERLVYNLVVGFDVYGNLTHQLHTRVYMAMIRMEGEENFLEFLPIAARQPIRDQWYEPGFMEQFERGFLEYEIPDDLPSQVTLKDPSNPDIAKADFYERVRSQRMPESVRQANRVDLGVVNLGVSNARAEASVKELLKMGGPRVESGGDWIANLPDVVLIGLRHGGTENGVAKVAKKEDVSDPLHAKIDGKVEKVITIARNKRTRAVGSLLFENWLRVPQRDDVVILPELAGSYPNFVFIVDEDRLGEFVHELKNSRSESGFKALKAKWGLESTNARFWGQTDQLMDFVRTQRGPQSGILDFTRYELWNK